MNAYAIVSNYGSQKKNLTFTDSRLSHANLFCRIVYCVYSQRLMFYAVDFVKGRSAPIVGSGPAADQDNCRQL